MGAASWGSLTTAGGAGAAGVASAGAVVFITRIAGARLIFAVAGFTRAALPCSGAIFIVT